MPQRPRSGEPRRGRPERRGGSRRPARRTGSDPAAPGSMVGTELVLDIGAVAHGGSCVARTEGRVVFVRHTLPGERVRARVTDGTRTSRFLRADAVEVLDASPERRTPACPWSGPGRCGGCDWQHTSVAYGRELKTAVVAEQLRRLAGIDWTGDVEAVAGDQDGLRWRTRVELASGPDGRAGFRAHRSHDVVPVEDCVISVPQVRATGIFTERFEAGVTGVDVAVSSDGSATAVLLPHRGEVPGVLESVTAGGTSLDFEVSARGFWQVHPGAAPTFVDEVLRQLAPRPGERVLDLYCGVGLFTRFLAERVGQSGAVLGIEGDERAVSDAQAALREVPQARIERSDVRRAEPLVERHLGGAADLVVLDPPRTGAGREVVQQITRLRPRTVAYVACDPSALARDLAYAADEGYAPTSLRAFDAFPMTHHVECIAILVPAERG
ncbi:class I SAM-dependent RNA methyltransferase [Allobranchiibius sp. GilTou73]|uniref:class I SAM-dependent RNA methyltransferase n=1 Tax=Allobranchiibius sp. GilTou73 TaxID=2904523 RepID=UPI001F47B8D5|nr:class I SAM-dependent RNA methyltransferase [Allobranchiibius sp. GilTou73]UIJ33654.1 class I SAM-dependent RNA methyltransferase [Allobranchiibius sp. GilTou73]